MLRTEPQAKDLEDIASMESKLKNKQAELDSEKEHQKKSSSGASALRKGRGVERALGPRLCWLLVQNGLVLTGSEVAWVEVPRTTHIGRVL